MPAPRFNMIDWSVLLAYMLAMVAIGVYFARRQRTLTDYFLADQGIPVWAAAISIVATSVSAVTFIGAPEDAYTGNLTYLSLNLSGFLAVVVVALFFVPAFYKHGVASIYEIIGRRFGPGAQKAASGMFLIGRVFASGARLFVAAIPFSIIAFGDLQPERLYLAIVIVTGVATLYTMVGGIKAVIWTETPQTLLFIGAAATAGVLLLRDIPLAPGEIVRTLAEAKAADGSSKLTLLDTRLDPSLPYSLWSALFGFTLFNMAVYGADQDLAQRMLTCKNAVRGAWSAVISNFIGLGVALLFLGIGLLLYIHYQRPDVFAAAGLEAPARPTDTRQVFLTYILQRTPSGLRGLMIAGVFAAAMSSLASALSAMASAAIVDFYKPLVPGRDERHYVRASRLAVLGWGAVLAAFACVCVRWQQASGQGLLPFAIGVMIFAYTGLLAVFLTALFSRRGSAWSVAGALAVGFLTIAVLRFGPRQAWLTDLVPPLKGLRLSMGWQMLIGTALALGVCLMGRGGARSADNAGVPEMR